MKQKTARESEVLSILGKDTFSEYEIGGFFFGILKRDDVATLLYSMKKKNLLVKSTNSRGEACYSAK